MSDAGIGNGDGRARRLRGAWVSIVMASIGMGCLMQPGASSRSEEAPMTSAPPRLARLATSDEVATWGGSITPDGAGLPEGSGSVAQGQMVYINHCLRCHGLDGQGNPADRLVGGVGSLTSTKPVKTVGSYWPYATTLFDYVRRAMPYDRPGSLSDDEVYAICAYLLNLNGVIPAERVMDRDALPRVHMPNRDGFVDVSGVAGPPAEGR